jgi:hypothetical protein
MRQMGRIPLPQVATAGGRREGASQGTFIIPATFASKGDVVARGEDAITWCRRCVVVAVGGRGSL